MGQFGEYYHASVFCTECGRALSPGARYCTRCGTPATGIGTIRLGEQTYALAGFGRRVSGHLIDLLLVTGLWLVVLVGSVADRVASGCATQAGGCARSDDLLYNPGWSLLLLRGIPFLYWATCDSIGTSAGRRLVGIRLVTDRGIAPGIRRGCVRALVSGLASGTALYLGYLWALWDRERRTWHDHAAKTWVVRR